MLARSSSLSSQGGGGTDEHLREQATAMIDAGIQLAKEAAMRKEMVLAQNGGLGGGGGDHLREQATATIDAGIQLAKEAALRKELELAKGGGKDAADDSSAAAKATFPFLNSSQVSIRVRDNVSGSTRDMNHCIFLLTSAGSNLDFGVII